MPNRVLIVAMDRDHGIGLNNQLPWHLPSELRQFKQQTTTTNDPQLRNAVIMGRHTFESIPVRFRPLPNRYNIVLSRHKPAPPSALYLDQWVDQYGQLSSSESCPIDQVLWTTSLSHALAYTDGIETHYIIGGAQVYEAALPLVDTLIITHIDHQYKCDAFFPNIPSDFTPITMGDYVTDQSVTYRVATYQRSTEK